MHELGIMANVLDIVLEYSQKNNVSKVHKISLEIGEYSGIVPHLAQDFFGYISKGSIAEGAEVEIKKVPLRAKCRDCGEAMGGQPPASPWAAAGGWTRWK